MSDLDPSYLRSIRDGIFNGNIEANNIEALPDGLVGLYDQELFPPTMKWKERKETLDFFLVFALAQKEISAHLTAEILGEEWYNHADEQTSKEEKRLQRVNELIQHHSKRLSSTGGGKYRLYHERFRVYVLQKVSEQNIIHFNDKLISVCETALQTISEKESPEKESYALEFLASHLFIGSMQGATECLNKEQALALKRYAYDQNFWERQIKISKGFEWSKKMLNQMMIWASKFNEDDEVIECALNKVDLYQKEQNDAPGIVQLVADGDFETALERIEKFGNENEEGLQRKFILYILCLMELTLLSSKDKDHAKIGIEKILNHFEVHINMFGTHGMNQISEILILKLAHKLKKYKLNLPKSIEEEITMNILFNDFEKIKLIEGEILEGLIWIINNYENKKIQEEKLLSLVRILIENKKFEKINQLNINLNHFERFIIDIEEIKYLINEKDIINAKQKFEKIKNEFEYCAQKDNECRILFLNKETVYGYLSGISKFFGNNELHYKSKNKFYNTISKIDNQRVKDELLSYIAIFFLNCNFEKESDTIIKKIKTEELLTKIYSFKSSKYLNNPNRNKYIITVEKINYIINVIKDEYTKDKSRYFFVEQLFYQNKFKEGLLESKKIKEPNLKNRILMIGALKRVKLDIKTAHWPGVSTFLREINDDSYKYETIEYISKYWIEKGLYELSLKLTDYIRDSKYKKKILYKIDLQKYIKGIESKLVITKYDFTFFEEIQTDLICNLKYNFLAKTIIDNIKLNEESNLCLLKEVAINFSQINLYEKSIFIIDNYLYRIVNGKKINDKIFEELFGLFCTKNNYKIAENYVLKYSFYREACQRLIFISEVLKFNNCTQESEKLLKTCFEIAKNIPTNYYKGETLITLLTQLYKNNLLPEYNDCKQLILNIAEAEKAHSSKLLSGLIQELTLIGNENEAKTFEVQISPYHTAYTQNIERVKKTISLKKEHLDKLLFEKITNKTIIELSQDLIESEKTNFLNYKRLNKILDLIFKTELNIDLINYIRILSLNSQNTFERYVSFAFNKAIDEEFPINFIVKIFQIKDKKELNLMLSNYHPTSINNFKTLLHLIKTLYLKNGTNKSLLKLIKIHGLHYIFFNNDIKEEKIDRLNRTLNLQWAIDIKNQLPN